MINETTASRRATSATLPSGAPQRTPSRSNVEFLRGFMRNPAQVGSVVPSSHRLEQRLVSEAHIAQARTVVELGPGTGGTTAAFLRAMAPNAELLAIELNPNFHTLLRSRIADPRFHLELGSAEHMADFLTSRHMHMPDAIISGIPFSTMPPEVAQRIATVIAQVLKPGGRFVAYQFRAHVADFLAPHLGKPKTQWELVNVPPVRVFSWVKGGVESGKSGG